MRFLFIAFLVASIASPIQSSEPNDLPTRLVHATAWVRTTTQGVGTGWIVDARRKWLITNLHVVGEQDRVEAFFAVEQDGKLIAERQYYLENQKALHEQGKAVRGKVIARREKSDLALVELEKLPDGAIALPLADKTPGPGQAVHSVGQRHDSDALWNYTAGAIRQVGKLTDGYFWRGKKLAADVPCLLVQSPINTGDSGSALVDHRGQVVGVISGVRWQAPITAIAIQASEVRLLLAEAEKKEPPQPSVSANGTEIYRKLLAATVWVRPTATEGRTAGWIVDKQRKLILTTASGVGSSDLVDVLFPLFEKNELIAEANAYADRIGLWQKARFWRGVVLMRDPKRDLALIELEKLPEDTAELTFATKEPRAAEKVHIVSHPNGVELLWLYSQGIVRQVASVELVSSSTGESLKPRALLLQIPHQASSSGGPVVNVSGEVVGMMAAKEAAQQQLGYAIAASELIALLKSARPLAHPEKLEDYLNRGKWLLSRGRVSEGAETFSNALLFRTEGKKEALLIARELFDAYLRAGELSRYVKTIIPAILEESMVDAPRSAVFYALENKPQKVRQMCEAILKQDRKCALAYLARGMLTLDKAALADLDEAIFYAPELIEAYRQRARVHEKLGDDDKALADWSRAIELDPYSPEPVRRRIALHLKKNEPKRAVADCERLIELTPEDEKAYRSLAGAWLVQGDETKALPALVAAFRWKPGLMREPILDDVIKHGVDLAKRWPDDSTKKAKWYEQALTAIRGASVDASFRKRIDETLASRKKEWDDARWGAELEGRIKTLQK